MPNRRDDDRHDHGRRQPARRAARRSSTRSRSSRATCIASPTLLESQRNLYESNLFRLAAIDVPPQLRQREERQHRRDRGAAARGARRPGAQQRRLRCSSRRTTRRTTCSAARGASTSTRTVGNLLASSLAGRGIFRDVAADVAGQPERLAVPPADVQREHRLQAAGVPAAAGRRGVGFGAFAHRTINPGVFIDHGYGGQATFTHQVAHPRADQPQLPLRDQSRRGERRLLLRELRRLRHAHDRRAAVAPVAVAAHAHRLRRPVRPFRSRRRRATSRALDLEHASALTASDYRYNRVVPRRARSYRHRSGTKQRLLGAPPRSAWCARSTGGADSGVLHPRKRFYAGGANSVRGYGENQLGPRILTIDASTLVEAREHRRRHVRADRRRRASSAIPNSRRRSATPTSFRSRSAARRCSRGASSIAFRCRSADTLRQLRRRRVPRRRRRRLGRHRAACRRISSDRERDAARSRRASASAMSRRSVRFASTSASIRIARRTSRSSPRCRTAPGAAHRAARRRSRQFAPGHDVPRAVSSLHFSIGEAY